MNRDGMDNTFHYLTTEWSTLKHNNQPIKSSDLKSLSFDKRKWDVAMEWTNSILGHELKINDH